MTQAEPVWLGLAGAYVPSIEAVDHYTTKVGGRAHYPGLPPSAAHEATSVTCLACKHEMPLVFQAFAPLDARTHSVHAPERTIYVYGCTRPGCGRAPGAWRAFSSQLPCVPQASSMQQQPSVAAASGTPHQKQPPQCESQAPECDAFGGFDDAFGEDAEGGDAFDFEDLNAALDRVASSKKQAQSEQQQPQQRQPAKSHRQDSVREQAPSWHASCTQAPQLPEFYVVAEQEVQGEQECVSRAEQAHINELLQQYQQENADGSPDNASGQAQASTAMGVDDDEQGSSDGAISWAGEEYEEESARGVHPSYLKFSRRLLRRPEQCVRYCRGSQPLWPLSQPPDAGTCTRCQAPCVFELQLMAPLITMIMEAGATLAEWEEGGEQAGAGVDTQAINGAANWDMCTLAVFTCSRACTSAVSAFGEVGSCCSYEEEGVVLVNEDACHVEVDRT